jgi:hypothetical protein
MKDKRLPLPRKIPRRLSKLLRRIGETSVHARKRKTSSKLTTSSDGCYRWTQTKLAQRDIPLASPEILLIKTNALT